MTEELIFFFMVRVFGETRNVMQKKQNKNSSFIRNIFSVFSLSIISLCVLLLLSLQMVDRRTEDDGNYPDYEDRQLMMRDDYSERERLMCYIYWYWLHIFVFPLMKITWLWATFSLYSTCDANPFCEGIPCPRSIRFLTPPLNE